MRHWTAACALCALSLVGGGGCGQGLRPDLGAPSSAPASPSTNGGAHAPDVVICVLDAARADHIGCYGYPRETTPNVDSLAGDSLLFMKHYAQATETKLSIACLFTSQYVETHRAFGGRPLPESTVTMARALRDAGYRAALFSSNLQASPAYGLGGDFDDVFWLEDFEDRVADGEAAHGPEVLLRAFEQWLSGAAGSPLFAYIHLLPPHRPYEAPEEMRQLFADQRPPDYQPSAYRPGELPYPFPAQKKVAEPLPLPEWINTYDACLRYGDWAVGEICRLVQDSGRWDNTILVVTSDHGEAFGEHGFTGHAASIHEEAARVPLLIRLPGGTSATRIHALTQSIDLLPTLIDLLGIRCPMETMQGRSLAPLIHGRSGRVNEYVFTRARGPEGRHKYAIRSEDYALLLFRNETWRELYDMSDDPGQRRNIIGERPQVERAMLEAFRAFAERQARPPTGFLTPEAAHEADREDIPDLPPRLRRELRALGYVN